MSGKLSHQGVEILSIIDYVYGDHLLYLVISISTISWAWLWSNTYMNVHDGKWDAFYV